MGSEGFLRSAMENRATMVSLILGLFYCNLQLADLQEAEHCILDSLEGPERFLSIKPHRLLERDRSSTLCVRSVVIMRLAAV